MTNRLGFALLGLALMLSGSACGGDDDRPAQWSYISEAIMVPNCATASCHSRLAAVAGLNFSNRDDGHRSLLGLTLPTSQYAGKSRALVLPGNPAESRVVNMLRARGATLMPPDRTLAEADIALVERWILNGAAND